ncbi:hypothetical protein V8E55_003094 [Tylopilus felleus]
MTFFNLKKILAPNRTPCDHSAVASKPMIGAWSPVKSPSGPTRSATESNVISTIGRNASDAAQTFLPPVQAVAGAVPCVGGIIKGVIGGLIGTLQLVDSYAKNKDDLQALGHRLHMLRQRIDNSPVARTQAEETMRWELLSVLETAKTKLEETGRRIHGSPSVTRDIGGCISTVNSYLLDYMVWSQWQAQNDVFEIKTSAAQFYARQTRFIENFIATGGMRQIPATISRGHAVLVDATGREHPMLLDHCRYLGQLEAMLNVILFQCRPDEAEIQRWYIERKQYDFVIYNRTNSDVIQLTRESDIWCKLQPGTRIVMRAITEEAVYFTYSTISTCLCGTRRPTQINIWDLMAASQRGCTVTCRHCERRFQITHTEDSPTTSQQGTVTTISTQPARHLIRNFLVQQVVRLKCVVAACIDVRGINFAPQLVPVLPEPGEAFCMCSYSPGINPCRVVSFQRPVRVFVVSSHLSQIRTG